MLKHGRSGLNLLYKRNIIYVFVICLFVLTSCNSAYEQENNKVNSFSFIDQNNQPFGTDELLGSFWIASFIFTNCETVCPPMMFETAALQKKFAEEAIHVEFVSFTVDPTVDTPETLKNYIQQFTNDETNWHMLTGFSQEEIETFAREQFETIVQKPETSNQVIHSTNFYLVDDKGYLLNEYNYIEDSYVGEMMNEIKKYNNK